MQLRKLFWKWKGNRESRLSQSITFVMALTSSLFAASFSYSADLLDVYQQALTSDTELAEAQARFQADHTLLAQNRANFLPSITVRGSSSRQASAGSEAFSYAQGFNTHDYTLNIQQSLFNVEDWYQYKAAQVSDQQAQIRLIQVEQDLIVRVATAYFDVLRSEDALRSYQAEEDASRLKSEDIQKRYDVGLEAMTDVNQAKADFDLARVNRIQEERRLRQRKLSLEVITGSYPDDLEGLSEDFPVVPPETEEVDDWIRLTIRNNPAIRIAASDFEARKLTAKATRAAYLPTLSVSGGYSDRAESNNPFSLYGNGPTNSASVQVSVSIPIFTGGLNSARKRQAYYNRDASEQVLSRTIRENERAAEDSYLGIENGVEAVQANQQAILSARAALEAVEVGAEVGTNTTLDVIQSRRMLYQALRNYAEARYTYVLDTLKLKQAAGVISPEDVRALNQWMRD